MQIQIYGKDIELTAKIKAYAEDKVGILDKFLENISEVQIDLARTTQHHKQGEVYKASANLIIPGKTIHADFMAEKLRVAIDGLVDVLKAEMKKMKGKRDARQLKGFRKIKKLMTSFLSRKKDETDDLY